jgi:phage gp16-like protein
MKDARQRDIAKIHIARKQLDLADDIYLAKLQEVEGVSSSKDLSATGRAKILAWLQTKGFKTKASAASTKKPKRPTPAPENLALVRRIRAQLISLDRKPDEYADGIAKQAYGVEFYEWCTCEQLHKVSQMLGVEQKRKGAETK